MPDKVSNLSLSDLVTGQQQPANPFDAAAGAVMHDDAQGAAVQIRNNIQFAVGQNPDQAAQYQHLAKYVGVPVETVQAQPDAVRQQAALKSMDADRMVSDYPTLAKYMTDPGNAAKSHDDVAPLAGVEQAVKALPAAPAPIGGQTLVALPEQAPTLRDRMIDWWAGITGQPTAAQRRQAQGDAEANAILAARAANPSLRPAPDATMAQIDALNNRAWESSRQAIGGMSQVPQMAAERFVQAATFGVVSPTVPVNPHSWQASTAGAAGSLGGFILGPGKVAGSIVGALPGAGALAPVAGEAWLTGLGKNVLQQAATLGLASALQETGGAVLDSHTAGEAAARIGHGAVSGAATGATFGAAGKLLPDNTIAQWLGRAVGVSAVQDAISGAHPLDDRPLEDKLFGYGLNALFTMQGAGRTAGGWFVDHPDVQRGFADAVKAQAAQDGIATLQGLGELAAASKTRQRDPEAFKQFVRDAADDGQLREVYVDANKFAEVLNQSGVTLEQLAAQMPDVAAQFPEAVHTQGDIRIPVEDYATHLAGGKVDTALLPHLKVEPDGMTYAQSQAHIESQQDGMQQLATKILADKQADDATHADAQAVHDKVLSELEGAGRFQPAVNEAYAAMTREFYSTMAARSGLSPGELYERYPLKVTSNLTGGEALQQAERGSFAPATHTIGLLKDADLSTYLHESGHFFLEAMHDMAAREDAPEGIKADFDTLLKSFGEQGETPEQRLADWSGKSLEEKRAGHEQFARGFERYLMEGKAPTLELQTMFSRFRAWMVNIYRSLTNLKVDLSPEVREVMDRMLASEEAITQAEKARAYFPLEAPPEGASPREFAEYQESGKEATEQAIAEMTARSLRDMQWASNAKARALKELQAKADDQRQAIRADVTREVEAEPVRQAQAYLRRPGGTDPSYAEARKEWDAQHAARVSEVREQVKGVMWDQSPEAAAGQKGLQKGQFMTRNKRLIDNEVERQMLHWESENPKPERPDAELEADVIAEMFGFENGKAMRKAIADAGNMTEQIERLTDQRMLEQHGELVDPASIERAAEAAIHNEARARFTATALKMLSKTPTAPSTMLVQAAREAAEAAVAAKQLRDLRPAQYSAAEARANREALKLAPRDPAGAMQAQRAALLNNQLFKAANDAVAEAEALRIYFKKFDRASVAKQVGADYMERIQEILSNYELSARRPKKSDTSLQDWMQQQYERTGIMPAVSDAVMSQAKHWSSLTVEELRGLGDAIHSLDHIGRQQTQVILDGKRLDLDALVEEARQSLSGVEHTDPLDQKPHLQHAQGLSRISAKFLDLKSRLRSGDAALLKMEQLFQMFDAGGRAGLTDTSHGAFSKIFKSMADAESAERTLRSESVADLRALADKLKEANVRLNDSLSVGLPRPGRGTQWYREELLAAALNTGNAGNLKKLVQGYGWTEQQLMGELDKHLSAPEWEFVQGVWDAIGKHGPEIEGLQKRQTGVAPKMVEPRQVRTRHGQYQGGYYPVVYDAFQDRAVETKQARNADMLFENQWAKPTTSKGHTVERTGYVGPVMLSLGVISRHLDQVTHDLAWREPITEANKFLSDARIKDEIDQTYGKEYTKQLRPWLQALANDKVFNTSGDSAWENFYRKARTNVTIMGLGYRLSTMMIHGASALSTSVGEVGAKWMAKGVAQFAGIDRIQNAIDFVYERSPEMRNRMNEMDRNVSEAIHDITASESSFKSLSVAQKMVNAGKRYAFFGVAMLDMASAMPTWHAAYLKGMAPEAEGGHGMAEEAAIEYANRAVRNAHGGGGTKDLAAIQRDKGAVSMATMFYSFWNHMYNRQRDIVKGYANLPDSFRQGTGTQDFGRLLARSWWYFIVPQVIHAMLKPSPQQDDGHQLSSTLLHIAEEVGLGSVSGIPFIRDLANAAVNGRSYTVTPIESAGKAVVTAAQDAAKVAHGEPASPKAAKNAVQAAGYVYGLPLGQASSTGQFLWDVVDGKQDPQRLQDWFNGISHGDMKQH